MLAIIDSRVSEECEFSLIRSGFTVLKTPPSPYLSEPLSSHPDMLFFKDGDTIITSVDYAVIAETMLGDIRFYAPKVRIRVTDISQRPEYPRDAVFNALRIGDKLFLKTDTAAEAVLAYAEENGLKIIHTSQGYPACTALAVSDNAAITADRGLFAVMKQNGVEVLLIENGGITLPPYEYGFIGGACGRIGNRIFFLGDPRLHPQYDLIAKFCQKHGNRIIGLSDQPLTDMGRIIFI